MIFAVDVQYTNDCALAAGIVFSDWQASKASDIYIEKLEQITPYEPGQFYKRELPCILAVLSKVTDNLDAIIVDGYVTLGKDNKPGLGAHLYKSMNCVTPIVGVAKKEFNNTPAQCRIYRGQSKNPLFVTSIGIPLEEAKLCVTSMSGNHRIPTLLKKVDQLCREV